MPKLTPTALSLSSENVQVTWYKWHHHSKGHLPRTVQSAQILSGQNVAASAARERALQEIIKKIKNKNTIQPLQNSANQNRDKKTKATRSSSRIAKMNKVDESPKNSSVQSCAQKTNTKRKVNSRKRKAATDFQSSSNKKSNSKAASKRKMKSALDQIVGRSTHFIEFRTGRISLCSKDRYEKEKSENNSGGPVEELTEEQKKRLVKEHSREKRRISAISYRKKKAGKLEKLKADCAEQKNLKAYLEKELQQAQEEAESLKEEKRKLLFQALSEKEKAVEYLGPPPALLEFLQRIN